MKKVLLTGAALMLVGGMVATDATYAAEPGVNITGNARVRLWYKNDAYDFNSDNAKDDDVSMDSRVRLDITGTAAGGAYAKARIRMYESMMGDIDKDPTPIGADNNIWVDKAYVGIPFNDAFTLEVGKYRSTYGPQPTTYNFFYDDVHLTGFKGLIKLDKVEINPFVEWMEEAQYDEGTTDDFNADNDEIRYGVHIKGKLNSDWTIGGMVGYQSDSRDGVPGYFEANEGFFGSLYVKGKSGDFGIVGEFGITDADLNGFNSWFNDGSGSVTADHVEYYQDANGDLYSTTVIDSRDLDLIGSDDTGYGGYIFPNFQIDKLNIGLNMGFTADGFMPDRAYGFIMLGTADNSKLSDYMIGAGGDWLWAGLVATYQISDDLKLTGNIVYADIDAWDSVNDGPLGGWMGAKTLDSALELSAILQYTISKGADVYFSLGMLDPDMEDSNAPDDTAFGALTRFELKF